MNIPKTIFLIFLLLAAHQSSAQKEDNGITLPAEFETVIDGIETKIIFLRMVYNRDEALADAIIGFKNPETGEWIFFDVEQAPFDATGGFIESFPLRLQDEFKYNDTGFIRQVVEPFSGQGYMWKCRCKNALPRLPL